MQVSEAFQIVWGASSNKGETCHMYTCNLDHLGKFYVNDSIPFSNLCLIINLLNCYSTYIL